MIIDLVPLWNPINQFMVVFMPPFLCLSVIGAVIGLLLFIQRGFVALYRSQLEDRGKRKRKPREGTHTASDAVLDRLLGERRKRKNDELLSDEDGEIVYREIPDEVRHEQRQ